MKSRKIAGERLVNYILDGINWKDHRDIVLDFWVQVKSRDFGYNPKIFTNMYYVSELPVDVQEIYEQWFKSFDFNSEEDDWIDFVNGTLNLFYRTSDPKQLSSDTWFVILMQSEVKAREICEEQIFHGNPNINAFFKISTTSKYEEIGGRRNGYVFSNLLQNVSNRDTRGFYWAVAFQAPESVTLSYIDGDETKFRCINWAADCKNMTLLKITDSGRFVIIPVDVEGKSWRPDRTVPEKKDVRQKAFTGTALLSYISRFFDEMYGRWEELEARIKEEREAINSRKNAMNVMNDEEVDVGRVVEVNEFIVDGNVPLPVRDRNEEIRKRIIKRNKMRDREINKKLRDVERNEEKVGRRDRNRLNPLLSKK